MKDSRDALLARLGRDEDWIVAGYDFRQIFSDFYPRIFRYFAQHGFGEEDSRDLAQEALLRVYRNLPSFEGDAELGTWVFQVTASVARDALRTQSRQKRGTSEVSLEEAPGRPDPVDEGEDPLLGLLTGERTRVLSDAVQSLPPQMRRCVELRVHRDLKYREIAVLMRISIGTVKAHLSQAREILRSRLADYFEEPNG